MFKDKPKSILSQPIKMLRESNWEGSKIVSKSQKYDFEWVLNDLLHQFPLFSFLIQGFSKFLIEIYNMKLDTIHISTILNDNLEYRKITPLYTPLIVSHDGKEQSFILCYTWLWWNWSWFLINCLGLISSKMLPNQREFADLGILICKSGNNGNRGQNFRFLWSKTTYKAALKQIWLLFCIR